MSLNGKMFCGENLPPFCELDFAKRIQGLMDFTILGGLWLATFRNLFRTPSIYALVFGGFLGLGG